jgi:hypothetical protein
LGDEEEGGAEHGGGIVGGAAHGGVQLGEECHHRRQLAAVEEVKQITLGLEGADELVEVPAVFLVGRNVRQRQISTSLGVAGFAFAGSGPRINCPDYAAFRL